MSGDRPADHTGTHAGDQQLDTVIFDLGGVVLRWDPRAAYRQVMAEDEVDAFMAAISFPDWNRRRDAGLSWQQGEDELITRMPERREAIQAYRIHFEHAIPGMVPGTAAVLAELRAAGVRLLALTNWAADSFARTRRRFGVLNRFEAIVVSGEEGLAKPDPAIFGRLLERHRVVPGRTVFIDDSPVNCEAARTIGLGAYRFTDADALRVELVERGLLTRRHPLSQPVYHLVERSLWHRSELEGRYPWSSRGLGYDEAGFVHGAFRDQLAGVRHRTFGDLADADLAVLRLDPGRITPPVVVEALDGPEGFPHLFGELRPAEVAEVLELDQLSCRSASTVHLRPGAPGG